jgi:branched-chain amino acid transport system ATP-binding protein
VTDGVIDGDTAAGSVPIVVDRPALALEGVTVRFGGITALDDVSIAVDSGEVCGLIGPNGAGKTTLFDVISGVRRARGGLRRTFQRVQTFGWLSAADNVLAALEWEGGGGGLLGDLVASPTRRRYERERRRRADEVLEFCGLTAVAQEPAGSLPIGTARMVEVARALVDPPRVLLLDEPTSGLEEREVERLRELIRALGREQSCAVFVVEHDVGFVMGLCDRVVVLDLGRVLAVGRPEEIQSNAAVRTAYLGEA